MLHAFLLVGEIESPDWDLVVNIPPVHILPGDPTVVVLELLLQIFLGILKRGLEQLLREV